MLKKRICVCIIGFFYAVVLAAADGATPTDGDWYPDFRIDQPVLIRPILFLPKDVHRTARELQEATQLFARHLEIAQDHYRRMLDGPTFAVAPEGPQIYRSSHANQVFTTLKPSDKPDSAHLILEELLEARGEDRYSCRSVFIVVYVRPETKSNITHNFFGGGRTINGPPGSGCGYVEMEYDSLIKEQYYRFQSTLVHELGHAFGLTHSTILGQSLEQGSSIMSYKQAHWSNGLQQSTDPGTLMPEEIMILSANQGVFPGLHYDPVLHNSLNLKPEIWNQAMLGPMDTSVGELRQFPGVGYELFYNGKQVNGPDAALYTRQQALANLAWSRTTYPKTKVEGRYNGLPLP